MKELEWTVNMNREIIMGGTNVIKGRSVADMKGIKSRRDDYRENTGLGRLGWERGSRRGHFPWPPYIKEKTSEKYQG